MLEKVGDQLKCTLLDSSIESMKLVAITDNKVNESFVNDTFTEFCVTIKQMWPISLFNTEF